jgi:meckelin
MKDDGYPFAEALFAGHERSLFIFELSVFLFIDFFAQNYVLAAFITYIAHKFINILRSDIGKINLARKTLVDKRFLI